MAPAALALAPVPAAAQAATDCMDRFRRTGDGALLAALYEQHRAALLAQIRGLLAGAGRRVEPEDVLHDAWLNIAQYRHSFCADRPEAFRIWAMRIVRNCAFRRLRGTGDRRLLLVDPVDSPEPVDPRPTPADRVEAHEAGARVDFAFVLLLAAWNQAFATAAPADRALLTAVEIDGLPYRELAARLGVRLPTIKVRVFRARQRVLRAVASALAGATATSAAA